MLQITFYVLKPVREAAVTKKQRTEGQIMAWMPASHQEGQDSAVSTPLCGPDERFWVEDDVKPYAFSRISQIIADLEELAPLVGDESTVPKFRLMAAMTVKNEIGGDVYAFFDGDSGELQIGAKYLDNEKFTRQGWLKVLLTESLCRVWPRLEKWSVGGNVHWRGAKQRGSALLRRLSGKVRSGRGRNFCRLCGRRQMNTNITGHEGLCSLCYGRVKSECVELWEIPIIAMRAPRKNICDDNFFDDIYKAYEEVFQ